MPAKNMAMVDGNTAAAEVAHALSEVCAITQSPPPPRWEKRPTS